jgi:hypothetical protein
MDLPTLSVTIASSSAGTQGYPNPVWIDETDTSLRIQISLQPAGGAVYTCYKDGDFTAPFVKYETTSNTTEKLRFGIFTLYDNSDGTPDSGNTYRGLIWDQLGIGGAPMQATRISGNSISTGLIQSTNYGSSAGSEFNLNSGTFKLGGSDDPKLSWDGTTLAVSGEVSASSGRIGGFGITADAITGSQFFLSGSATGNQFFISSSKFNIKANGDVTGSNVLFTGGKIGGSFINTTKIVAGASLTTGQRIEINGAEASMSFFNAGGNSVITLDDNLISTHAGMHVSGTLRIINRSDFGSTADSAPLFVESNFQSISGNRLSGYFGIGNVNNARTAFSTSKLFAKGSCGAISSSHFMAGIYAEANLNLCPTNSHILAGVVSSVGPTNDGYSFYGLHGDLYNEDSVGIGTTNPTSKLHVVGTGNITGNTTIGGTLGVSGATTLSSTLEVAGTTTLTGTKPITIEPSSGFMKIKGVSGGWTAGSTFLGNSNAALGGFTILGNNNSLTRFIIGTWSTDEKMVILANGNVGIGTTAPGTAFDVKGSVQIDQYAAGTTVANTAGSLRLISSAKTGWGPGDELGKIEFYNLDTSGVGVRNAASIRAINSQGNGSNTTTFNGELAFYTSAHNAFQSEAVRINSAGNVGIGDSSPSYQLELSTNSAGKPTSNTWTVTSDERIKENIQLADLDRCYDIVKNLPLKHYKWREDVYSTKQIEDRHALGWIAQDVKSVFPKAVNSREFKYNKKYEDTVIPAVFDENGIEIEKERTSSKLISEDIIKDCLDLDSGQIIASLYGAVQKLIAKVEALENK